MSLCLRSAALRVDGHELLQPVSARFEPGRVTAVLGPNGAGKSSLLSLASGQRRPSSGDVSLGGRPMERIRPLQLARWRAVMPQDTAVSFDYTAREVVALGRYPHHLCPSRREADIVEDALEAAGVRALGGRIHNTLSGGEKARVQLARALAQIWEPVDAGVARWLLLDEPTAALDLAHQHRVMQGVRGWARERGVGVVAVIHDLNLALRYADDALVLGEGRLMAFGPARQTLTPALIERLWSISCREGHAGDGTPQFLFDPG